MIDVDAYHHLHIRENLKEPRLLVPLNMALAEQDPEFMLQLPPWIPGFNMLDKRWGMYLISNDIHMPHWSLDTYISRCSLPPGGKYKASRVAHECLRHTRTARWLQRVNRSNGKVPNRRRFGFGLYPRQRQWSEHPPTWVRNIYTRASTMRTLICSLVALVLVKHSLRRGWCRFYLAHMLSIKFTDKSTSVAEYARKPLYRVNSADLGTGVIEAEKVRAA